MDTLNTVLITGANRGIGLECVRQYAIAGWRVYATCRSPERAPDLSHLAVAHPQAISVHPLDVTEPTHLEAAADLLAGVPLKRLINNAGVLGPRQQDFGHAEPTAWIHALRVNTLAPLLLMQALVDHLTAARPALVVNLSSRMGSIDDNHSGGYYIYRSTKAALNAVVRSAAIDLAPRGISVVALHPGWVRTEMGGAGAELEIADSVTRLRATIERLAPADSGGFFDLDGESLPW